MSFLNLWNCPFHLDRKQSWLGNNWFLYGVGATSFRTLNILSELHVCFLVKMLDILFHLHKVAYTWMGPCMNKKGCFRHLGSSWLPQSLQWGFHTTSHPFTLWYSGFLKAEYNKDWQQKGRRPHSSIYLCCLSFSPVQAGMQWVELAQSQQKPNWVTLVLLPFTKHIFSPSRLSLWVEWGPLSNKVTNIKNLAGSEQGSI